ncbi:MAG: AAA family ATPase [Opitutales bacterium]|nr:AAA family ATPase [Opitutales bacterium]
MITNLKLKNFTVFRDLEIDFSRKINVIIGENGTGKSHLLKAAYAMCSEARQFDGQKDVQSEDIASALTTKFIRLFLPIEDKLGKLRKHGVAESASVVVEVIPERGLTLSFHTNSKTFAVQNKKEYELYSYSPVFIPTKEVLSFMKGFNSLYEKYGLSFDQTYQDICLLLDLPEIRPETLQEKSKWAMTEIEKVCGGRFVFYGGGKVTFKTENAEYSANAMAEGFRKAGMLSRLLETGAIQPGVSGPLFWDEPEANLNPKLMKLLVEILLELSRNGQQIILATHDYVLLKWLDLLMDKGKADSIRYHVLYQGNDGVEIDSADRYQDLDVNSITETYGKLYDHEIERALGRKET